MKTFKIIDETESNEFNNMRLIALIFIFENYGVTYQLYINDKLEFNDFVEKNKDNIYFSLNNVYIGNGPKNKFTIFNKGDYGDFIDELFSSKYFLRILDHIGIDIINGEKVNKSQYRSFFWANNSFHFDFIIKEDIKDEVTRISDKYFRDRWEKW